MSEPRAAIRRMVIRFGLHVLCVACGWTGRHRPEQGRLRDRRCPECEAPLVAKSAFLRRMAARARDLTCR